MATVVGTLDLPVIASDRSACESNRNSNGRNPDVLLPRLLGGGTGSEHRMQASGTSGDEDDEEEKLYAIFCRLKGKEVCSAL